MNNISYNYCKFRKEKATPYFYEAALNVFTTE